VASFPELLGYSVEVAARSSLRRENPAFSSFAAANQQDVKHASTDWCISARFFRFAVWIENQLTTPVDVLNPDALPSLAQNPPTRWKKYLGEHPSVQVIEDILRMELTKALGQSEDVFEEMHVKVVFKGITYELLNDPEFTRVAARMFPSLGNFHDEFDAAAADKSHDTAKLSAI
jgi:hypothetical protein